MKHCRTVFIIFLSVLLIVALSNLVVAQTQTARIIVKGVTPDLRATGRYNVLSSGLPNVGKGQKVWLEALALYTSGTQVRDSWIDTIISQTWTLTNPPGGSAAIINTDTTTYFITDTTGQYKVDLSVTTSHGTKTASIYINSAKWIGVGNIAGSPGTGQCALGCHSQKVIDWENTRHSRIFEYNVDSSDHYSASCVSCHSVGYDTNATAVNGGWDDVAKTLGFTIPSPQHPGVWDSVKINFPTLANVSNIQCENCHGPGSLHNGSTDNNKIAATFSSDMCGQCHGRKTGHIKNYEWGNSGHAKSQGEPGAIEHMNSTSCTRCHTAQGFAYETIGGKPAATYTDVQPVTCTACHDPHSDKNPAQLRVSSIGDACKDCHKNRISSRGLHHSPQGPMLAGVNGTPYTLGLSGVGDWGGLQFPGFEYRNSSHTNITNQCAECHMAVPAVTADTAMVPIPRTQWRGKLGGHTFKVVWDKDTPDDPIDDVLNPFGCKDCHGNASMEFVEQSQDKIHELLNELSALLPHRTSGDTTQPKPHTDTTLTTIQRAASYNWYFVEYDGSFGVHNYEYASALLRSSIELVKLGAGAADIASINDVPNDQGKQVQIVWNKFPAENYPDPLVNYLVLRQDSSGAMMKAASVVATSFRDMLSKVVGGSTVTLGGSVWTKVGEYKAINLPKYSLVVPTLFDSTITTGKKSTVFEVVGYTATNAVYASLPDTGYSVDNLAPSVPSGLSIAMLGNAVRLQWDKPGEEDCKYIAVYRSTAPNFVPSVPYETESDVVCIDADVVQGTTYYYKLAAYDFSGNRSNYSAEISIFVLDVGETGGIPREFALQQNHPNPFNPVTKIRYQLPEAGHVKIQIYNTIGTLVSTLVDRYQEAGYYTATWDGIDNGRNSVASGIYMYKMEAGSYTSIKKMMFIK